MTLRDFEQALFRVLTLEAQELFKGLDNEFANSTSGQLDTARLEPAASQTDPKWSLSQWSNLRLTQVFDSQKEAANESFSQDKQPVEIRNLQSCFPGFYASIPDQHLNN